MKIIARTLTLLGLMLCMGLQNLYASDIPVNPKKLKTGEDYLKIVKYYRYLKPDSALYFVKEGIAFAKKHNDKKTLAALFNQNGMIDDNATRFKEAKEQYEKAETLYRELGDEKGEAAILVRLGVVEKRKGNYDKSLAYFYDALRLSEKNNDKLGLLEARVVLSEAYYSVGDYSSALKNLDIAQKIDSEIPLSNFTFNMYISYGYTYVKLKEYDSAIHYLEMGLKKCNKTEYNGLRISLLKVLAIAYFQKGNQAKAEKYFLEALSFARQIKNVLREQSTLTEFAEVYMGVDADKALYYFKQALRIVEENKLYIQQITILNKMSELYEKKKDLKKALECKAKSYSLAEQFYYRDMMKQVTSLETAYNLEKSNAQVKELKLKSSKATMVRNVTISIALAALIILAIILANYYKTRHLNKLLQQANSRLEENNRQKDKFFSIVAHDIRSPLVSTIGFLNLINDGDIDAATREEIISKLSEHCENSLEILDKLLKWGQMQIKGIRLNVTTFNAIENIQKNVALIKEAAMQKNISIHLDVSHSIMLQTDSNHFDFVIRNLLSNAVKFTQAGGTVRLKAETIADNKIQFKVIDTGVGIAANRINNIFNLSSISTKGTSQEEGTSLGLIICKEFIQANKGELSVESEVGKGTVFTFILEGFDQNKKV
ncbi:tetratricopeptide repeat protein [Pedobacter sp.]|uniref:tetratricopeptide repeat-containing sensor histidine kinase n=1 Tax=Pedobacter sp. TaxID=1411316 RepID=UPI00396C598A